MSKTRIIYRSAVTGKFVGKDFAKANPRETIRHIVNPKIVDGEKELRQYEKEIENQKGKKV